MISAPAGDSMSESGLGDLKKIIPPPGAAIKSKPIFCPMMERNPTERMMAFDKSECAITK